MIEHYVFIIVNKAGKLLEDNAFNDSLQARQRAGLYKGAIVKKIRLLK